MFTKHKNYYLDIALIAAVLLALFLGWALSRTYALVQQVDLSFSQASTSIPPGNSSAPAAGPPPDTIQFNKMTIFHQQLTAAVNEFTAAEPNEHGIYIKHLPTGDTAADGAETQFMSASLYKPIVAVEVLRMVDAGELTLDEVLPETDGRTVRQCIQAAISVSDNPCGRALRVKSGLGTPEGLKTLRQMGLNDTDLRGEYPVTTARDIGILFERLDENSYLSRESNALLIDALKAQRVNDRLTRGLPQGTTVAHKTGDLEGTAHDAGIVYSPKGDYVIVLLSGPDPSGRDLHQRYEAMAGFTARIHDIMLNAPQL